MKLEDATPVTAPDGCTVSPLVTLGRGSLVHCNLGTSKTSYAVRHTVIEEIWYFISGMGEIWRRDPDSGRETVEECGPGLSIAIPEGVSFQFRALGPEPLQFLCLTMPPWPGEHVAQVVEGKWTPEL